MSRRRRPVAGGGSVCGQDHEQLIHPCGGGGDGISAAAEVQGSVVSCQGGRQGGTQLSNGLVELEQPGHAGTQTLQT